jgi:hypothetical protein
MATGYEVGMYHDLSAIRDHLREISQSLHRIAGALEAGQRPPEDPPDTSRMTEQEREFVFGRDGLGRYGHGGR